MVYFEGFMLVLEFHEAPSPVLVEPAKEHAEKMRRKAFSINMSGLLLRHGNTANYLKGHPLERVGRCARMQLPSS